MYVISSDAEVQTPIKWDLISRPHDDSAICVIAQKNSSFIPVSYIAP